MLKQMSSTGPMQIAGIVYIDPHASREALLRLRRFLDAHARGHCRWGYLYQYPKIEFDDVSDLNAVREKFPRLLDGYMDLSDRPERAE
jgi:hypothetical protein